MQLTTDVRWRRSHRLAAALAINFALGVFVVPLPLASLAQDATERQAEDSTEKLQAVEADIQQLKEWLNKAKREQSQLHTQLENNEKALSELSKKVQQAEQQRMQANQRLKKYKRQAVTLNAQLLQHETHLAKQLALAYRWRDPGWLKTALSAQSPAQATRQVRYLSHLNQARMSDIESYRDTLEQVRRLERQVYASEQQLQQETQTLLQARAAKQIETAQRTQLLSRLKSRIDSKDKQLQASEQQRRRLEALLVKVEQVLERYPYQDQTQPFAQRRGLLPVPVKGQRTKSFDQGQPHEGRGWVIRGQEGATVRAVHHGRVVFSDWLRGYGLLIIVDHGQGYMTLYARNQSLIKSEGEWVNAGDAVATLGRSGGYETASLYFEIRHKGKPINPSAWLTKG